ncbi:major type 1 subunit fimbrin (pilin) [Cupriavidus sp. YR651]|nr:major type 1 subunit fimbrin (pilin) [Cupriavidus sp. YR651]
MHARLLSLAKCAISHMVVGIAVICLPGIALADCSSDGSLSIDVPVKFSAPINVGRDVAVGQDISAAYFHPVTANAGFGTCTPPGGNAYWQGNRPLAPGFHDVYESGVPGIGLRFEMAVSSGLWNGSFVIPYTQSNRNNTHLNLAWHTADYVKVHIVKTASTTGSGLATPGTYATMALNSGPTRLTISIPPDGLHVNTVTCQTPDVVVNLGNHATSELGTVNAFSASTNFEIALNNCPGGIKAIKYEVDAATSILDADRAVVALDAASTAKGGVGVQLLDGAGNPHKLGVSNTLSGVDPNGGNYKIPLRARYFRTGAGIGAGSANTSMTFTMSYE